MAGLTLVACGGNDRPEPKQVGVDTLTVAEKTAEFALFPSDGKVENAEAFIERDFLGVPSLDYVYKVDYESDGARFKLFMTRDVSGVKYINFRVQAGSAHDLQNAPASIVFDDNYSFMYKHPEYGTIIAGLKNNRLVGILGLDNENQTNLLAAWVASLPAMENSSKPTVENK
ncbi:MAG: hypothetical protein PHU88_07815 [candidate division Zixibacteria bacterium]|nr:hypothetical protein [candidate division Zixibacteria bacterium]